METNFSIHDLIYAANSSVQASGDAVTGEKTVSYQDALEKIRHTISKHHSAELIDVLYSAEAGGRLKNLITRYLNLNRLKVAGAENISELADRIYEDMAGFGILTKYLQDEAVEEININAWNAVEVVYPDRVELIPETFLAAEDCVDKIKKMVWLGGSIIDGSHPIVDSFIGEGIRISAIIPPCVDKAFGGVASIRRQKSNIITREMLIEYDTATAEELDFLSLCINHGVSVALAGSTGSGKTTDLAYLISCLTPDKRIYTIEDTRELDIARFNDGRMINRVVQTLTKDTGTPITMNDLLKEALRFHPDVIVPAEMRGREAMTAQEAGRTGHTILTTLHANSAADAYNRILSMCVEAQTGLSENKLLEFILEAIPVVVYKRQLSDGRRVYSEIFEGTGIEDGRVVGKTLFQYEITDNTLTDHKVTVIGTHKKCEKVSGRLIERLRIGGANSKELARFL